MPKNKKDSEVNQESYRRKQDKVYKDWILKSGNVTETVTASCHLKASPTSYVLMALLLTSTVISAMESRQNSKCIKPTGDYAGSCSNITIKPYDSIDPNVPPACQLEADCNTIFEGLKPTHNKVYYPANIHLTGVSNKNGTLIYQDQPLARKSDSLNQKAVACSPLSGSYKLTCETAVKPYLSSDPNLSNTSLCKAETSCQNLEGRSEANVIYFNLRDSDKNALEKIENCNGMLIANANDHRCQDVDVAVIKDLAEQEGERLLKL